MKTWFALNVPHNENDEDVVEVVNASTVNELRSLLERALEFVPPGKWYESGSPADKAAELREHVRDLLG